MSVNSAETSSSLTRELFDFEGRTNIEHRTAELTQLHTAYISNHPELQMVLHDFMQSILFHKPADSLAFTQKYFQSQREKHENVYHA